MHDPKKSMVAGSGNVCVAGDANVKPESHRSNRTTPGNTNGFFIQFSLIVVIEYSLARQAAPQSVHYYLAGRFAFTMSTGHSTCPCIPSFVIDKTVRQSKA